MNGALVVGTNGATFNSLLITNGGDVVNTGAGTVGFGTSNNSATVMGSGSYWTNKTTLTIGQGAAASNTVTVANGGNLYVSGSLIVGTTDGGKGGNNALIISNAGSVLAGSAVYVGYSASSNLLQIIGGDGATAANPSILNGGGQAFDIGYGSGASSNTMIINGGGVAGSAVLTNVQIQVGANSTASFNNSLLVTNGGKVVVNSGATMSVIGGTGGTIGARSNSVFIAGGSAASVWDNAGVEFRVGNGNGGSTLVGSNLLVLNGNGISGGAILTNVGSLTVANNESWDSVVITNGGKLITSATGVNTIGKATTSGNYANNNLLNISGGSQNSIWDLSGGSLVIGSAGGGQSVSNTLWIGTGGIVTNAVVTIGVGGARTNSLLLNGGQLWATSLVATSAGNAVFLNSGTLATASTVYSNGTDFVVGNGGATVATLQLVGGTHLFQNNLVVTNNGILAGIGNITVNSGSGIVNIQNGGALAPGAGGTLAITGINQWSGGGEYFWQISDFTGASGGSTDLVTATTINITATSGQKFVIDVGSFLPSGANGVASNFNNYSSYQLTIATATAITGFNAANFSIVSSNFQNAADGVWSVAQLGNSIVLNYEGATNFVWNNVSGNFATGGKWQDNAAPPVGQTNVVLTFGGNVGQSYTANNDLTGLVTKRIVLTNSATTAQYIIGNSITLAGVAPDIQQNGTGGFVISNNLVLAKTLTLDGTNTGKVELDGSISGGYGLVKTGSYTVFLGGANSYTGQTTIAQGQVIVANASALSNSVVNNQLAGGLVFSNLAAATIGGLTGSTGLGLTNTAGQALALTMNSVNNWTYSGTLSGAGSLTKSGSASGTLSGNSTYTGDTLVNQGTLAVSGTLASTNLMVTGGAFNWANTGALTNTVAVSVTGGGAVNFSTSGTINALSGNGQVNLGGNTLQVGYAGASTNFSGTFTGSGTLSKEGAGTWTLTGGNSTIGNLVADNGWLVVSGATMKVAANSSSTLLVNNGGTFQIDSGTVVASNLTVNTGGQLLLNGGTLSVFNAAITNANSWLVGNGQAAANFNVVAGGTAWVKNGLVVTNGATLSGAGTVSAGNGVILIGSGATISPMGAGNAPTTLAIVGTNVWASGGQYLWNITDFSVPNQQGVNWDLLTINGLLSNTATTFDPFAINISASTNVNFNRDSSYSMTIATATSGLGSLNVSALSLVLTNFNNLTDGIWSLSVAGGNSLVLNYVGVADYVWNSVTGGFVTAGNWVGNVAPPVDTTNIVLTFGGNVGQSYTANNDLTGLVTKRIVLTNSATTAQYIIGNSITLAGVAPDIQQNGTGGFVISNNLVLAKTLTLDGTNTGKVELDGSISGGYGLVKTGSYTVFLGGANSYTGQTTIAQGQVIVANASALSNSVVNNQLAGGLVFSNLAAATIGGLTGSTGLGLTNTAGQALALTMNSVNNWTYSGTLSGAGSLTKSGSASGTLSGNSTYTGDTLVNQGTLAVSGTLASTNLMVTGGAFNWANTGALTNTVAVSVTGGGAVNFSTSGTINALSGNGQVNLGGNTLQVGYAGASTNFSGTFTGSGTLSKEGAGTWTLTGGNSTIGNLVADNGWLVVSGATMKVAANSSSTLLVNNGGTFQIDSGTVVASNLTVNTGGVLTLNGGTLTVRSAVVSNGSDFVIGNGQVAANFGISGGGTAIFQKNLIVTNGAILSGAGNIVVNGGAGSIIIQSGASQTISGTGTAPGLLTVTGNEIWQGGGTFTWDINNFNGSAGNGYDSLNLAGGFLTTTASSNNQFVIDINALNPVNNLFGVPTGFNYNSNYTYTIVSGINVASISNALANNDFFLNTTDFSAAHDGTFQLAIQGTSLVLSYVGSATSTWMDVSGNFSSSNNWISGRIPSANTTNVVMYFGGTAGGYYANNDLTNLLTKKVILTNNNSGVVQTITGSPFTFVGVTPVLEQDGSGAWVISNAISVASTLSANGSGGGTVTLAGNISGAGTITLDGTNTLVLSGTNTFGTMVVNDGHLFIANSYGLSGSTLSNFVSGAVVFTNNVRTAYLGGLAGGGGDLGLTNTTGDSINLVVGGNGKNTTYTGTLSGSGSLTKAGGGTLILSSINTYSGGTAVSNGTLVVSVLNNGIGGSGSSLGSGAILVTGGTLRFGNGSLLAVTNLVNGSVSLNGGTLQAASFVNQGHVANLGNTSTITSDLSNLGTLDINAGALNIGNLFNSTAGIITVSNGASLVGSGWVTNAGLVTMAGGTFTANTITNTATFSGYGTLSSTIYNAGLIRANVSNQVLTIAGAVSGGGSYQAAPNATLSFNGGGTLSSLSNSGGTVRVTGGLLVNTSAFDNHNGTLALASGSYQANVQFTNTGWLVGYGSFNSSVALVNKGTIDANLGNKNTPLVLNSDLVNSVNGTVRADSSAMQINGVFTNNGTLQFISSVGTYSQTVLDNGAWNTYGGSSNIFAANFVITTNGYVNATSSDRYIFHGGLINESRNSNSWNTLNVSVGKNSAGDGTQFIFSGTGLASTQTFYTTGLLLTNGFNGIAATSNAVQDTLGYAEGFSNNFAVGQVWLTNTTLVLAQAPGMLETNGALFVNSLYLFDNAHLIISNDMTVYFANSNGWSMSDITLWGNAQIHQLTNLESLMVIPEPNVLLMWLCGGITVWAARRRRRQNHS